MYTHTHTHARTHARTHIHTHTHTQTHTHRHTDTHTQTHTHAHTQRNTCTHVRTHTRIHTHTHTHTHTHKFVLHHMCWCYVQQICYCVLPGMSIMPEQFHAMEYKHVIIVSFTWQVNPTHPKNPIALDLTKRQQNPSRLRSTRTYCSISADAPSLQGYISVYVLSLYSVGAYALNQQRQCPCIKSAMSVCLYVAFGMRVHMHYWSSAWKCRCVYVCAD